MLILPHNAAVVNGEAYPTKKTTKALVTHHSAPTGTANDGLAATLPGRSNMFFEVTE